MRQLRSVTVYCSSSNHVAPVYFHAAKELGAAIAKHDWTLVYGGNAVGCMGALADAARAAGGRVVGITPRALVDRGIADERCDELIITDSMRERKHLLEQRGDAFCVLPGGIGTFEEFFEILVGRQLGYHDKPIVLLNVNDYYGPLLAMLEHGLDERFLRPEAMTLARAAASVDAAIGHLLHPPAKPTPPSEPLASTPPSAIE
jgi:uncharacterized protein (TIGR00730 family)